MKAIIAVKVFPSDTPDECLTLEPLDGVRCIAVDLSNRVVIDLVSHSVRRMLEAQEATNGKSFLYCSDHVPPTPEEMAMAMKKDGKE